MNLKFNAKIIILISVYFLSITINAKTINIVTITQDFSSIAKEIGGDLVNVSSLVKGSQN